ncbi:MAG TPA: hypothetical protein PLD20_35045 [Blastocatellia bacterium]|nr:hypothetical protein [Blastocatellia bacterium]HMX29300.1 hypothetical protein [Blastocatellia bacterium]HMZ23194.1 hypothetical protein [Blastocatellia bacterium]HNG33223.1 hypothetical protein [Blastocatellia bacterium]
MWPTQGVCLPGVIKTDKKTNQAFRPCDENEQTTNRTETEQGMGTFQGFQDQLNLIRICLRISAVTPKCQNDLGGSQCSAEFF